MKTAIIALIIVTLAFKYLKYKIEAIVLILFLAENGIEPNIDSQKYTEKVLKELFYIKN